MTSPRLDRALSSVSRRLFALPDFAARALAGGGRVVVEGAELDPKVQLMLRLAQIATPEILKERPVPVARRDMERSSALVSPSRRDLDVTDRRIPGPGGELPIRVYRRRDLGPKAPVIVFFHGGGWVLGSIGTHDGVCHVLADEARAVVVSVDYRLAPEHPWPAAPDDAFAAFLWVHAHAAELGVDPARIAVAGDSAGGNLAAIVCLDARDAGGPSPCAQALIYPGTELRRSMPSHRTFAEGYLLTKREIDWFVGHYVPAGGDLLDHPRVSPFRATLGGLPRALVVTAGFDPLRDEGRAYADRLGQAGVPMLYRCEQGMIHGFASFAGTVPAARDALLEIAAWLGRAA